ncbi:MAG: succinylglutamate desuccinylase/aspartoacylase family protein, partial [Rhizobiaceae bacterium]
PKAYLQAALHGGEFPGVAAIHFLVPLLEAAEKAGTLAGNITIVPMANPIGSAQWLYSEPQGRFELFSRTKFNRDHFALDDFDTSDLPALDAPVSAAVRLKAELLRLALPHEIILDLHCDDESEQYMYIQKAFWPGMRDLAAALNCTAVMTWKGTADLAFEEAAASPALKTKADAPDYKRRAVTTVEFKGMADVSAEKGMQDAKGLYAFLVHRGAIKGRSKLKPDAFDGPVAPLENTEMVKTPAGGMVFFHVGVGDTVKKGAKLATIITKPGDVTGDLTLTAPQSGFILTRRKHRFLRRGDDVLKLLAAKPSKTAKPGSLEA